MADPALAAESTGAIPEHVPPSLVIPFDFYSDPLFSTDPFDAIRWQRTDAPRIFYSPTHYMFPGGWVITRAEDIRYVQQNAELFSSREQVSFAALLGEAWDLIPLEVDPPRHKLYRTLLNPLFSPKEIARLECGVQESADNLISKFASLGGTEFVRSFAQAFPVSVFLRLMGLPIEEMPTFLDWEKGLLKSFNLETRRSSARSITDYLRRVIISRRKQPGEDLISRIVVGQVDGRALNDEEVIGICFLLFIAGLDTVASSLGFHFRHLAADTALQSQLRADRTLIPAAVEEFLRIYSIVISHRRVAKDTEIAGVTMKKGDWISVPTANGSRDAREFSDPDTFKLDRDSNRHVAFSYGIHRCIGSHLARREFVVAINRWFDLIPPFELKPGSSVKTVGGAVFGVEEMHLVW